jgi:tRNA-2-methylthio-N6-dimethylallyladenosine synthase
VRPGIRISSDFIVGFPGETEEDFGKMMKLIDDVGFDASFSFIFSKRPGTPAASLADDTPQDLKVQRLRQLQARIEEDVKRISAGLVGTVQRILVEGPSRNSGKGDKLGNGANELMGRTECNRIVNFDGGPNAARLVGQMIDVSVTEAFPHSLRAKPVVDGADRPAGSPRFSDAPARNPATTA